MPKKVIMPKFGMDQEEGTVATWLRHDGDAVEKGEPILEVETDKVNMEVEAPASGILQGIRIGPGVTVPIGEVIAYILKPGETLPVRSNRPIAGSPNRHTQKSTDQPINKPITPVAQQMADAYGVDPAAIPADGPRITKGDVERHVAGLLAERPAPLPLTGLANGAHPRRARGPAAGAGTGRGSGRCLRAAARTGASNPKTWRPNAQSPISQSPNLPSPNPAIRRIVPLTAMRRTIAARLTASVQQIPQFTASVTVNMERANQIIADIRADSAVRMGRK